mgnify:CR=1 FL=1
MESIPKDAFLGNLSYYNKDQLIDTLMGLNVNSVSYTHLRAHETVLDLVCRLLLEKKKNSKQIVVNRCHTINKDNILSVILTKYYALKIINI